MSGYTGTFDVTKGHGDYNAFAFLCQSLINKICTVMPVKIIAVNAATQTVNVTPLVNQINGSGVPTPHGVINNIQYCRIQGGASAVIIDPIVGDLGFCVFASHDISSVKVNKGVANPGSRRRYDWADGIYIGGILNGVPSEFIQFTNGGGVTITTPANITMNAANVVINGNVQTTGTLTNNGHAVGSTHEHGGVTTGTGNTGTPL